MRHAKHLALLLLISLTAACAGLTQLAQIVQPPRFDQADGQRAEIRVMGPSASMPAGCRSGIWSNCENNFGRWEWIGKGHS